MVGHEPSDFVQLDLGVIDSGGCGTSYHQSAPGKPADRYARAPSRSAAHRAALPRPRHARAPTTELNPSLPRAPRRRTTARPRLPSHRTLARATRCPGDTRSDRGDGNPGAYRTWKRSSSVMISDTSSRTRKTMPQRSRPELSLWGMRSPMPQVSSGAARDHYVRLDGNDYSVRLSDRPAQARRQRTHAPTIRVADLRRGKRSQRRSQHTHRYLRRTGLLMHGRVGRWWRRFRRRLPRVH